MAENAETMKKKEEQSNPKALTEIKAREPNTNNFIYVTSEDGIQVPVPKGYVVSTDAEERYVNGVTTDGVREHHGGFVIYEKNAGETDEEAATTIEENLNTAKITRNQWVWVPIADVTDMYHVSNGQLYGNIYYFSSNTYSKGTGTNREPGLVPNYDNDQTYLKIYLEGISRNELLQEMRDEFYEMLESIATYGGYYIGRYETGNINQKIPVVRKGNSAISNINWYLMYKRCKNLKGSNQSVQTGMIWGIQWDEVLKWLIDTGEKTYAQVYNSNDWGNHREGTTGGCGSKRPTGYSESWKGNNIFDLAGNVAEWTMEPFITWNENRGRTMRGGHFLFVVSPGNEDNDGQSLGTRTGPGLRYWNSKSYYTFRAIYNGGSAEEIGCRSTMFIL